MPPLRSALATADLTSLSKGSAALRGQKQELLALGEQTLHYPGKRSVDAIVQFVEKLPVTYGDRRRFVGWHPTCRRRVLFCEGCFNLLVGVRWHKSLGISTPRQVYLTIFSRAGPD